MYLVLNWQKASSSLDELISYVPRPFMSVSPSHVGLRGSHVEITTCELFSIGVDVCNYKDHGREYSIEFTLINRGA